MPSQYPPILRCGRAKIIAEATRWEVAAVGHDWQAIGNIDALCCGVALDVVLLRVLRVYRCSEGAWVL